MKYPLENLRILFLEVIAITVLFICFLLIRTNQNISSTVEVSGQVQCGVEQKPLSNVQVILFRDNLNPIVEATSENGTFRFLSVKKNQEYKLVIDNYTYDASISYTSVSHNCLYNSARNIELCKASEKNNTTTFVLTSCPQVCIGACEGSIAQNPQSNSIFTQSSDEIFPDSPQDTSETLQPTQPIYPPNTLNIQKDPPTLPIQDKPSDSLEDVNVSSPVFTQNIGDSSPITPYINSEGVLETSATVLNPSAQIEIARKIIQKKSELILQEVNSLL